MCKFIMRDINWININLCYEIIHFNWEKDIYDILHAFNVKTLNGGFKNDGY